MLNDSSVAIKTHSVDHIEGLNIILPSILFSYTLTIAFAKRGPYKVVFWIDSVCSVSHKVGQRTRAV